MSIGPLFILAAQCPACASAPALRVYAAHVHGYDHLPRQEPVQTYQCKRTRAGGRLCNRVYTLYASAWHDAFMERAPAAGIDGGDGSA
ncbi:MAG: hypothetical protein JWM27_94 [Gemmatimonadetes bacterium]|nr:hypothetical protein [Gemmatimonadota bacterium]